MWVDHDMPPNVKGNVVKTALEPRSYIVNVTSGQVRRNRSQLHERNCLSPEVIHRESTGIQSCLKSGAGIHLPQHYQS